MDFRFEDNVIGCPHALADVRHQGLDIGSCGMTDIHNKIGMDREIMAPRCAYPLTPVPQSRRPAAMPGGFLKIEPALGCDSGWVR